MSVKRPCGRSFARSNLQRPSTTAASEDSKLISMSEKLSVPIFARSEYFWRYRARTVSHPRRTESSEIKTVDAERAYPFMNPSMSPRFQASCCARRIERIWATILVRSCSFPSGAAEIEEIVVHAKTTAAEVKSASATGRIKSAQRDIGTQTRRIICKNDIFL